MYFDRFPLLVYAFKIGDELVIRQVRDIVLNVRVIREVLENVVYYEDYDIEDTDTPEIISERIYGNPLLHWVIMLVNEKYDYLEDFPIPEYKFDEYVTAKYGEGNEYDTHKLYGRDHYISPSGRIVDSTYPNATAVSNIEYEREINQAKRRIRIVHPKMIDLFIKNLQEAFAE
jgi:hypothetical protein